MRFISELIEKKKASEPEAANQDGKARVAGGLALHDATRRRPVSLIGESFAASQRRRDTSGWGADPDDLADSLEGGPEHANTVRPRNGFHRAVASVRRTEIPRETPAGSEGGTLHPMQQCGRPSTVVDPQIEIEDAEPGIGADESAEVAPHAPLLLTGDEALEAAEAPLANTGDAAEQDDRASVARNLDLAFETPLKAVTARLSEEVVAAPAEPVVDALTEAEIDAAEIDAAADEIEDGDAAEAWDDDEWLDDWGAAELELADAGADADADAGAGSEPKVEEVVGQALRVWDLETDPDTEVAASPDVADDAPALQAQAAPEALSEVHAQPEPAPATDDSILMSPTAPGHAPERPRAGRVKTRLLGFHRPEELESDPFAAPERARAAAVARFPVGWLVVVQGPGRGASHALFQGVSTIGRSDDQTVPLDHGDTSISRQNHAAIAYDEEQNAFFIGHGGKANLVRLNGMPVLSTEPLTDGDRIRIGETTLRFVALCGSEFSWGDEDDAGARDAATI